MKNNSKEDNFIVAKSSKEKKSNSFFSVDNVKPIIGYFSFTTKYILKKKSTISLPIISFIVVLFLSIIPMFFISSDTSDGHKELFLSISITTISSISISLTVLFATTKALNLFKDISNDGLEILIVSKPITRSQIIFVRFAYFLFLGILLCLANYFALLIGLSISSDVVPNSFSIFNYITLYFFSMMMVYILFGSISIMFSLRFSTKLVSSLSLGIMGIGIIFSQIVPQVIPIIEQGFYVKLNNYNQNFDNDPNHKMLYLNYQLTTDGKVIIYTEDIETPLTVEQKAVITKIYESRQDLSWIISLNQFINPVAGIAKMSSVQPTFFNDNFTQSINFNEFKVSLASGEVKNNLWEGNNYFVNIQNVFNHYIQMEMGVMSTSQAQETQQSVMLSLNAVKAIMWSHLNYHDLLKTFDELLLKNLFGLSNEEIKQLIIGKTEGILKNSFDDLILSIKSEEINSSILTLKEGQEKIKSFNEKELKDQLTILLFYLYGLEKLNKNISSFNNREIFLASIPNGALLNNTFLGVSFEPSIGPQEKPMFYHVPATKEYEIFINNGEKVNSALVGTTWSSIVLVILVGTIIIYFRKDFL